MILDILQNIGLGTLGLLIFTAWSVREHLKNFSFSILINKNKPFWIWSVVMLLLFSILLAVSPESADAMKTLTGLDVKASAAAFITMGIGLGRIARDIQKGTKKPTE